jgi:hypothetical protein
MQFKGKIWKKQQNTHFHSQVHEVECRGERRRLLLDVDQSRMSLYTAMDASSNSVQYRSNMAKAIIRIRFHRGFNNMLTCSLYSHELSEKTTAAVDTQITLNTGPTYGTLTDTMDIMKIVKKWKHFNGLEKCHIYLVRKDNLHKNDIYIDTYNPLFEDLYGLHTR